MNGDEVVELVRDTLDTLRRERDELLALLAVVDSCRQSWTSGDGNVRYHVTADVAAQISRRANPLLRRADR